MSQVTLMTGMTENVMCFKRSIGIVTNVTEFIICHVSYTMSYITKLQMQKCDICDTMTYFHVTFVTQFVIYVTFVTECLLSLALAIHYWKLRETTRILCEHNSLEN